MDENGAQPGSDRCIVGLIGAGIGSSATPSLHEVEADALGIRYAYQLIDLDVVGASADGVGELLDAARRMGFRGLNITHPCKQEVLPHLDDLAAEAAAIGAVNTVVFEGGRAVGHNTDVVGFQRSFELGLPDVARGRVVVVGAGGAGAAVAYAALRLGAGRIAVVDLDPDRADDLARRLDAVPGPGRVVAVGSDSLADELSESDGLIHATPTGMAAHPGMPFSPDLLRRDAWVADIVYRPLDTPLLRHARAIGCRTLDGGGMAVFQAVAAFRLFTRLAPDPERMLEHFDRMFRASADDRELPVAPGV